MLSVERITAGYIEGIDILKDVSLGVRQGTITGIIGPNGSGKSTLLKTIFGFLTPHQGRILMEGYEIQSLPPYRLKEMGMSYMLQDFSTFPQLSVNDNLLLGAYIFRKNRNLVKQRLEEVYEFLPLLRERKKVKATVLSGGLLRILSLGKEIMTKPRLLLIDEPSAGVAPNVTKTIYEFLMELSKSGTTILLVDQNITKALEVSDFMYLLEMGRVKQEGSKRDFEPSIREIIRDSLVAK